MKKKLIAFSFLSLFALTAINANAQTEKPVVKQEQDCCVKKGKCPKGDIGKAEVKKAKHFKKGPKVNPFDGINLTAEQQTKIDKLKADRKENRTKEKEAQADKRKKEREKFNKELASILTPEQMAQYNANCEKIAAKKEAKKEGKGDRKGRGDHKKAPKQTPQNN